MNKKEKLNEINNKYKDKLLYPVQSYKIKNYWTGDQKKGKYHDEYHAKTKNMYDIYAKTLEELEDKLK